MSDFCVDGVCCNSACNLPCDRCNVLGFAGTCRVVAATDPGSPSCTPYRCSGDGGSCATNCSSDVQCATTAYCVGGACVPKKANGQTCPTGARECLSGFCSDGYCCNTACTLACDRCNRTNLLGTCGPAAARDPGNPSCSPYVCDGNATSCPTQCTSDAGCAIGYFCSSLGTCVGSVTALRDDFNDNALSGRWSVVGNIGVAERNMQLELTIPAFDAGSGGVASSSLYDATGASVIVELKQAANSLGLGAAGGLRLRTPSGHWVGLLVRDTSLQAMKQIGGTPTLVRSATYIAATMRWLRIREANGTTSWEHSPDGLTWVVFASESNPVSVREVYVELVAGITIGDNQSHTYVFDNVNP